MQHGLGGEAFGFIREELFSGRALAKRLASVPPGGNVVAILPDDTARAELTDFGSGGLATGDEVQELAEIVRGHLSSGANRVCVFEHPTSRVGDPRMPEVDYLTVGEYVYPFLSNQSGHESIVKAARETHWYPSIGVMSSLKRGEPMPEPGSAQPVPILDELVTRVDAVLVGAYDAESWLVWYPEHGLEAIS